jgi:hypothetical protein
MPNRYLIDHRVLFIFGYFFYLFTPYIVGTGKMFEGYPGVGLFQSLFQLLPPEKLRLYMIITLAWLPAFFLGHFTFQLFVPGQVRLQKYAATPVSLSIPYVASLLFMALVVFIYLARNSILGNYSNYDVGARGKMSTLLVIFNFFMVYLLLSIRGRPAMMIAGALITAMILLAMGGRMYVFQTFIVILIYKTSFSHRKWTFLQILSFAGIGLLTGSAFGLWRMGSSLNIDSAAYSFFAEPTFTWFSTTSFLINNDISLLNWPANFLSSFLNLVPNTIISLKPYLVSLESMASGYKNPLGADSAWSTLVINFGSIGSVVFIFITGFILNFLRYNSAGSRFGAVYYIMVCGIIPFQFFRDGFFILNKQLFFNFLIFPAFILLLIRMVIYLQLKWLQPKRRDDSVAIS